MWGIKEFPPQLHGNNVLLRKMYICPESICNWEENEQSPEEICTMLIDKLSIVLISTAYRLT